MRKIKAFKERLSVSKNIVITTHHKPDADALGSSLGLANYLQKKGHDVTVISPSDYPAFLEWMHGNERVIIYEGNEQKSADIIDGADMIFCLDFSCLSRINGLGELVRAARAEKVLIDHHLEPEHFADFEFWSIKAAATAELVYDLITEMGDKHYIDTAIAESLYAGIMTDTGSFKHSNTSSKVFRTAAELVDLGADNSKVSKLIYDNNSVERMKFLGFALNERLIILEEYKTAYFAISAKDLARFNSKTGDTEGLVNFALSIKDIVIAAVIIDRGEEVRISFRSIGDFPVNELAKKSFGGGGHRNAAGGKSDLSLVETVKKFEKVLPLYKDKLNGTIQNLKEHAFN